MSQTSETVAPATILEGTVWVNDTRPYNKKDKKTGKPTGETGTVRDISINFEDLTTGERIFVKYTLWNEQVEKGDSLKPQFHGKLCTVESRTSLDWSKPRSTFTDRNGRSCREYMIRDAEFQLAEVKAATRKEAHEETSTTPTTPTGYGDNPSLALIGGGEDEEYDL